MALIGYNLKTEFLRLRYQKLTKFKTKQVPELRVICAMRASMVYVPTCQHATACQLLLFTCQRGNKRANVPKACQCFKLVHQRPKGVLVFLVGVPTFLKLCQHSKSSSAQWCSNHSTIFQKTIFLNF